MKALLRDPSRVTKLGSLAIWTAGFLWLILGGGFTAFLRPSLWPLLAIGLVMAVLLMLPCLLVNPQPRVVSAARRNALFMRMGVLCLPLVCLALSPHFVLTSYAYGKRAVTGSDDGDATLQTSESFSLDSGVNNPTQRSTDILGLLRNAEKSQGDLATVEGIVYRDERVPKGYFILFRFAVRCCAADATPVGVLVKESGEQAVADDKWTRVSGTVAIESVEGKRRVLLKSSQVREIAEPPQPYLYP